MKTEREALKQLRTKIKGLEKDLEIYKDENRTLRDSNHALKARAEYATAELVDLTQGIGVKPEWYSVSHTWDTAMKHKAALALKKLTGMRLP